ncbi:serine-threonine protein kinase 19-domain-containing protein [Podospora aff. communis PSN243]|uniref:Serine-threonine protein kinase 19-domain-containing protein n=1 Tax=Podospora aff. communis PSN243 TaxID=3040156 RepID=A0AAV9GSB6_9PEZI|nr:serine-threonine protein kinase 19-domain-containing protein [Podospora aff. communis PSN243]
MTLRKTLGFGDRVKKRKPASNNATSSPSTNSPWLSSLQVTKPTPSSSATKKTTTKPSTSTSTTSSPLPNAGPAQLTLPTTTLTIPLAHSLILDCMFTPLPERASGLSPAKIASILTFRDVLPHVVSTSHLQTLLPSPTAAEREIASLIHSGGAKRVVVPRKNGIGELLVLREDLEGLVRRSNGLDEATKDGYLQWLRGNPAAIVYAEDGEGGLDGRQVDALVRAGFLTAVNEGGRQTGVYARPAEKYAMLSLETVSRASAGTIEAVGGEGALFAAGGSGGKVGGGGGGKGGGCLRCTVPGAGAFLKLASGALEHLGVLLERTRHREMPESDLREKWDGGIAGDKEAFLAKKNRGEFAGILPGRTKKWKDFYGVSFDWVLREAVGAGLVEVFETHSVGRGVRLV